MSITLYPYQERGVRRLLKRRGRALLADEMGLGKTIQVLEYARRAEAFPLIVVCPATLKSNWAREVERMLGVIPDILEGRPKRLPRRSPHRVTIVNYDILDRWLPYLKRIRPKLLLVDEAHYCKNRRAVRTRATWKLGRVADQVIPMTGTPIDNRPMELWSLLHLLDRETYSAFTPFAMRYCGPKLVYGAWDFRGSSNLEELREEIRPLLIRRLKADVLQDLPKQRQHVSLLDIQKSRRKVYDGLVSDFRKWLSSRRGPFKGRDVANRFAWWSALRKECAKMKLRAMVEWLRLTLESEEKVVAFGIHRALLERIHRAIPESVLVYGGITSKEKQRRVDRFQLDSKCRLFLGNIHAAGVGLNLTAARVLAFLEIGWAPGEVSQAAARIDRIGQKQETDCYFLVAPNTVETMLCGMLEKKQSLCDLVIDGRPRGRVEVMALLEKELLNEKRRS